jgi:peptidoglycan/LPS O-acetylase OafA/YrhL
MKKIHQLEGVRGFGALIVYICHFQLVFVPYFYGSIEAGLTRLLPGRAAQLATQSMDLYLIGCVMLHIFWMLSGYVIFIRFFRPGTGRQESLLAAVCRRYLRLAIPCAVAVLFSYVLLQGGLICIREVVPSVMGVEFFNFQPNLFAALRVAFWNVYFNFDFVHTYNGPLWTFRRTESAGSQPAVL